jgi:UDP-2,4-diacetamido-2,4,6-trideoxy-beta-L-altropyranose hydrolase
MRCLALAQTWQDSGGQVVFASAEITDALRKRLADERCGVVEISAPVGTSHDVEQTVAAARERKCDWLVVDGYTFGAQYQQKLKAAGLKVLFVDDYGHAPRYFADLILNQNVTAASDLYAERETQTKLLLGTKYCLLRGEFTRWRNWQREIAPVCRQVLVLMGGSDPGNITARVIEALAAKVFEELEITVVVGGSNPNFAMLEKLAPGNITLKRNVTGMAELMAAADLVVSAAGITCWELCFMGLPALLIDVAENQSPLARELDRRGCAIHVEGAEVSADKIAGEVIRLAGSSELRRSLSQRSRELVDGRGAERIVSVLRGAPTIRLRRVKADDARLLWEWANDPDVRASSFSSAPIQWETHAEWFAERSNCKKSLFLIAEDTEGCAVGQIRFDLNGCDAELNVSVAKEKRGLGIGTPLVEGAVSEIWANTPCMRVHAFVKPENTSSARTFERAGFIRAGVEQVRGNTAVHFVRIRT